MVEKGALGDLEKEQADGDVDDNDEDEEEEEDDDDDDDDDDDEEEDDEEDRGDVVGEHEMDEMDEASFF